MLRIAVGLKIEPHHRFGGRRVKTKTNARCQSISAMRFYAKGCFATFDFKASLAFQERLIQIKDHRLGVIDLET